MHDWQNLVVVELQAKEVWQVGMFGKFGKFCKGRLDHCILTKHVFLKQTSLCTFAKKAKLCNMYSIYNICQTCLHKRLDTCLVKLVQILYKTYT